MMPDHLLAIVREKPASAELLEDGTLVLRLSGCNRDDLLKVQAFLQQARVESDIDYRRYFAEIRAYPLFKPSNPVLAIRYVAKQHGLDASELAKAFRELG